MVCLRFKNTIVISLLTVEWLEFRKFTGSDQWLALSITTYNYKFSSSPEYKATVVLFKSSDFQVFGKSLMLIKYN